MNVYESFQTKIINYDYSSRSFNIVKYLLRDQYPVLPGAKKSVDLLAQLTLRIDGIILSPIATIEQLHGQHKEKI